MSLKKDSANLRNENFSTNRTETKIAIRVTSLNTSRENVLRTSTKINSYHTTITTKLLRQQKLSLQTIIVVYREQHVMMTAVTFI